MQRAAPNGLVVVDLFCGMGGFSCGAVQAGARVVLAIDEWDEALRVHKLNHPQCHHEQMTLGGRGGSLKATAALIRRHVPRGTRWHLHGSPPCQALSMANRHRDEAEGMRLVNWYLALVRRCRPDSWSMEQVPPVRQHIDASRFEFCDVVNAVQFGLPQTRRRLFVGDGWKLEPSLELAPEAVSVAHHLPHLSREGTHIRGVSNYADGKAVGPGSYRALDQPSFTLVASRPLRLFKITSRSTSSVRPLTVDEELIIQGFPQDYQLADDSTLATRYRLLGNSVCPPIARLIVCSAAESLRPEPSAPRDDDDQVPAAVAAAADAIVVPARRCRSDSHATPATAGPGPSFGETKKTERWRCVRCGAPHTLRHELRAHRCASPRAAPAVSPDDDPLAPAPAVLGSGRANGEEKVTDRWRCVYCGIPHRRRNELRAHQCRVASNHVSEEACADDSLPGRARHVPTTRQPQLKVPILLFRAARSVRGK